MSLGCGGVRGLGNEVRISQVRVSASDFKDSQAQLGNSDNYWFFFI